MKPTLVKNDKNLKKLNQLIVNEFYSGYINEHKFELKRNYFPNNFRIIGVLKSESFEISADYTSTMSFLRKFLLVFFGMCTIYFLITQNWLMLIIFSFFLVFDIINYKFKVKKEIELFTDKLLVVNSFREFTD